MLQTVSIIFLVFFMLRLMCEDEFFLHWQEWTQCPENNNYSMFYQNVMVFAIGQYVAMPALCKLFLVTKMMKLFWQ